MFKAEFLYYPNIENSYYKCRLLKLKILSRLIVSCVDTVHCALMIHSEYLFALCANKFQ